MPFPADTEVIITFTDMSATGECFLNYCRLYLLQQFGKFQPHAGGANVALAGIDYGNSPVVVMFAAGETVSSKARIPIKDDGPGDHNEQFRATFELPSGYTNIQKGTPSEAVVAILEEDIGV